MSGEQLLHSLVTLLIILEAVGLSAGEGGEKIREISYKSSGYIHSKQISENGDSLLIGYRPSNVYDEHTELNCAKAYGSVTEHKDVHLINIIKRPSNSYQIQSGEAGSKVQDSDYFLYVRKEVWSCYPGTDTTKGIIRIVNELVGFKEIFEIKYYDGIEVSTMYNVDGTRSAKIREIRYINIADLETAKDVLRYEGLLEFQDSDINNNINIGIAGLVDTDTIYEDTFTQTEHERFKEVTFDEKKSSKTYTVSDTGITLMIGSKWQKTLGDEKSSSICFRELGIHPLPFEFRPAVALKEVIDPSKPVHSTTLGHNDNERVLQITQRDLAKFFVPISEEVWNCKTTEGLTFHRIVNEMHGRKTISKLEHYDGVNRIMQIKYHKEEVTARFREVKYLDTITKEIWRYRGTVRLVDNEIPPPPPSQHGIHYKLNADRLYRTLISPKGYDLRIGSRWEKTVGTKDSEVKCKVLKEYDYAESYLTKFRVRVRSVNEDFQLKTYKSEYIKPFKRADYFDYVVKEFRVCHSPFWKLQFLRVVNIIDILVPVHEIEFYNGVEVYENILSPDKKSVRIKETKYMDSNNLDVVKYEGKLEMEDETVADTLENGIPVKKSDADVFWRVGHLSAKKTVLKELFIRPQIPDLLVDTGDILEGGVTNPRGADHKQSQVVCTRPLPQVERTARSMINFCQMTGLTCSPTKILKHDELGQYFQNRRREEWNCESPKEEENLKFYRSSIAYNYKRSASAQPYIGMYKFDGYDIPLNVRAVYDETNKYILEFHEVVYFLLSAGGSVDPIRFEGEIVLDETMDDAEVNRMSGTEKFEDYNEKLTRLMAPAQDVEYHDKFELAYKISLEDTGIGLEIGKKWKRIFGDSSMVMECKMDDAVDSGQFDTYMRTRITKYATDKHNQLLFETYFNGQKSEVWICTNVDTTKSEYFLRVVNQFSIKPHHCKEKAIGWLYHRDGIKVMVGDYMYGSEGCMEIAEVKYLDPDDFTVLKFEGKIKLLKDGTSVSKKISALRLQNVAQVEVKYLPETNKPELMRTKVQEKGLTIEVGSHHEQTLRIRQVSCHQKYDVKDATKRKYLPKILMNQYSEATSSDSEPNIEPLQMTVKQIYDCFKDEFELWNCEKDDVKFYRVMTRLEPRETCPIARVYHHMGVTVSTTGPHVYIKEIKFIDPSTNDNKVIRFEGFLNLVEKIYKDDEEESGEASREIIYELDLPTLFTTEVPSDKGVTLEVGSQYEEVFGSAHDSVLCERDVNHKFDPEYTTKVASNYKGLDEKERNAEMDDNTFSKFFDVLRQEVWTCKKNTKEKFFRVVNFIVAIKDIVKLYHPDGITIGTQEFPDKSHTKQIKEVKYLHPDSKKVLRYDGEMTLETIKSKKSEILFQMPSQFEEFYIETRPPGALRFEESGADSNIAVKFWSVDILRVHALRLIQKKGTTYENVKGVTYTSKNIHLTKIAEGYNVKMKVGSQWEEEFKTADGKEINCLLDEWNPTNKEQFLTKVLMYFGEDMYELDEETITDNFNIKRIEVWVCVNNRDTILRVVTELVGTTGIFVVLHKDGVEVNPIKLGEEVGDEEKTARIVEYKYLDPRNFKVLKYAGKVKLIKAKAPEKTEIAIPLWRTAVNTFQKYWLNVLQIWEGVKSKLDQAVAHLQVTGLTEVEKSTLI